MPSFPTRNQIDSVPVRAGIFEQFAEIKADLLSRAERAGTEEGAAAHDDFLLRSFGREKAAPYLNQVRST